MSTVENESANKILSDEIPFLQISKLMEKMSKGSAKEKLSQLGNFIKIYRIQFKRKYNTLESSYANGDSLYPLIRTFLPANDTQGRPAFGFGSSQLGKMLAKILSLDKNSPEGKMLIEFKDPIIVGESAGDLSTIVYSIVEKRSSKVPGVGPPLAYIHLELDKIAKSRQATRGDKVNQTEQIKVLTKLFKLLTPLEAKWLTRLLLRDLKLSLSMTSVLKLVHPEAKEFLDIDGKLESVCQKLNDPTVNLVEKEVSLFRFFRPMLASFVDGLTTNNGDDIDEDEPSTSKTSKEKRSIKQKVQIPEPPFYLETKWDGERFQIHYERNSTKLVYYSRRGHDFSSKFNETLTPRLAPLISPDVQSFIIDGEMMAWRKKHGGYTTKGQEIDVKQMRLDNENHCPAFIAFDILFKDGIVLMNKPLRERLQHLDFFQQVESTLIKSEVKEVHEKGFVMEALNEAIDNLEEGLLLKAPNGIYEPGKRSASWLKIKPEYIEGSALDDLDLLVIGVYYSESVHRSGKITRLLVGLIEENGKQMDFIALCRVSSGLKHSEMDDLIKELEPYFLKDSSLIDWKGERKPDFFINPQKSIVVQVKASEITHSSKHTLKLTLRFPRITAIRRDKPWDEVLTSSELYKIRDTCGGKMAKRNDGGSYKPYKKSWSPGGSASKFHPSNHKGKKNEADSEEDIAGHYEQYSTPDKLNKNQPFTSTKSVKTALFKDQGTKSPSAKTGPFTGKSFMLIGGVLWNECAENQIKVLQGKLVKAVTEDTFAIISEKPQSRLVNSAKKQGQVDILTSEWLTECVKNHKFILPSPPHFLFMCQKSKESRKFDDFGDSLTEKLLDLPAIKKMVEKVITDVLPNEPEPNAEEIKELKRKMDQELFPSPEKREKSRRTSFFEGLYIAMVGFGEDEEFERGKIEFYRGAVVGMEDTKLTHVVIKDQIPKDCNLKELNSKIHIVTFSWLQKSLKNKVIEDEYKYIF